MYTIHKVNHKITDMNDPAWATAEVASVTVQNWAEFTYIPNTTAKLLYSAYGIHVQLCTDDQPLLARFNKQNDPVCKDTCMEFFFCPKEGDPRYINLEFNAFGTMFLAIRTGRADPMYPTEDKTYFEVTDEVTADRWTHQFTVPFAFIDRNFGGHSTVMRGNIYKCGDETHTVHYASYYPVKTEKPDYHQSAFFGEFVLG